MGIKQEFSKQITKINMKTSSFLEENKLKTYMGTLEGEIRDLKFKAGETGYKMWAANEWKAEEINAVFEEISGKYQLIKEQEEKLAQIELQNSQVLGNAASSADGTETAKTFCPNCGAACPANANFCKSCGAKLR